MVRGQMGAVHTLQAHRAAHGVQQADDEAYINSVKGARPAVVACTRFLEKPPPTLPQGWLRAPSLLDAPVRLRDLG